jgi:hypothetical protein
MYAAAAQAGQADGAGNGATGATDTSSDEEEVVDAEVVDGESDK